MNPPSRPTGRHPRRRAHRVWRRPSATQPGRGAGLTLIELLLGLGLGMALFVTLLQALLLHGRGNERLVRLVRERGVQRQSLALQPACSLAGRRPVLHLQTAEGWITYTLGSPPSNIWRGQVLMRCGPAYGLDGEPSSGSSQNRVLLDALTSSGFEASRSGPVRLRLRLQQQFRPLDGQRQTISSGLEMATAEAWP